MKKTILFSAVVLLLMTACNYNQKPESMIKENATTENLKDNPLLKPFDTPFGVPPYNKIKPEHYLPALKEAIKLHNEEIQKIINNPEPPTFKNTVAAFARSGRLFDRVTSIFFTVNEANTNEEMEKIAEEFTPLVSAHEDDILLNQQL